MKFPVIAAVALLAAGASACSSMGGMMNRSVAGPAPICSNYSVQIYFERDSFQLTREARGVLNAAADRARGCQVTQVDVLGLADAVGDPAINQALSEKRAAEVTKTLARRQIGNVRVAAAGEAGAQAPSGEARPLRRRVEVAFRVRPK